MPVQGKDMPSLDWVFAMWLSSNWDADSHLVTIQGVLILFLGCCNSAGPFCRRGFSMAPSPAGRSKGTVSFFYFSEESEDFLFLDVLWIYRDCFEPDEVFVYKGNANEGIRSGFWVSCIFRNWYFWINSIFWGIYIVSWRILSLLKQSISTMP